MWFFVCLFVLSEYHSAGKLHNFPKTQFWRRPNTRKVSFETFNGGQFTLSTQLIVPYHFIILLHRRGTTFSLEKTPSLPKTQLFFIVPYSDRDTKTIWEEVIDRVMPWTCEMCRQWPNKGIWSSFCYYSYLVLYIWIFFVDSLLARNTYAFAATSINPGKSQMIVSLQNW